MGHSRARGAAEKDARRDALLASGRQLLSQEAYPSVTMSAVAATAGLAKGTTYLYFPTKEALFLALLREELGAWFDRVAAGLPTEVPAVAAFVAGTLASEPLLLRLLGLLHLTLEANVDAEVIRPWKVWLATRLAEVGAALEAALPSLPRGQGAVAILHLHALTVGLSQMATTTTIVDGVLAEPGLAGLRVDFEPHLAASFGALLQGMLAR
jgi:AcrR family transcriptional regulator